MESREILQEIDVTLDQLIKNAAALTEISADPLYNAEVRALSKTQESLLAHLLHLDQFLKDKQKEKSSSSIHQKLSIFSKLSADLAKTMKDSYPKPTVKRHKKKSIKA
jgi:uncharacterized protein YjgD (DUF1641 family)